MGPVELIQLLTSVPARAAVGEFHLRGELTRTAEATTEVYAAEADAEVELDQFLDKSVLFRGRTPAAQVLRSPRGQNNCREYRKTGNGFPAVRVVMLMRW